MKSRFAALLLSAVAVAPCSALAAPDYLGPDRLMAAASMLWDYCVEGICLGTTVATLRPKGVIYWQDEKAPSKDFRCSPGANLAEGQLALADGRRVDFTFEKVTPEGGEEQYRLTSIYVPAPDRITVTQLRYMAKELGNAWHLPQVPPNASWSGITPGNLMRLTVAAVEPEGKGPFRRPPGILADASLLDYDKWLMSLPECRAGLPKIRGRTYENSRR